MLQNESFHQGVFGAGIPCLRGSTAETNELLQNIRILQSNPTVPSLSIPHCTNRNSACPRSLNTNVTGSLPQALSPFSISPGGGFSSPNKIRALLPPRQLLVFQAGLKVAPAPPRRAQIPRVDARPIRLFWVQTIDGLAILVPENVGERYRVRDLHRSVGRCGDEV